MDQPVLKYNRMWRVVALSSLGLLFICNPGWSLDIRPSNQDSHTVQGAAGIPNGDVALDVEGLLHDAPKNGRLFNVGRLPKSAAAKDQATGAADENSLGQDERAASDWIELEIDKDGTYLFFGDADDAGPAMLGPPEEHMMPGGIGLTKKWHF